jgi:hypothetical protein
MIDETEDDELQPLRDEGFLIGRRKGGAMDKGARPFHVNGPPASNILRNERNED